MDKVKGFGSSIAKAVGATFKNEGGYTAVKITKFSSGTLELDHDALRALLFQPKVGGRPIALISIAGCLRTGKSFLLNFLLRYLRNEGWNNKNWLGESNTKLDDGINWRGGQEPNTTGILVWNEVFILKKRNGDELAVLLMDTQGLFDNNTTRENNIRLLMTSAIASSVQLLNIKNLIQERDLENLHTCVQFAMAAAKTNENQFQLQTLLIIIRDWDNVEENDLGLEGGNMYLESVLRAREGGKELNEVRKYLRDTFSKLECYLMPEPGKKVRRSGHGQLENNQIDEEFLEYVEKFTDHLLHPENIVAKQSQGKYLSARQILNLLATIDSTFHGGKIVVEDLVESSIKSHYTSARDECVEVYEKNMKKKHNPEVVASDEDLKKYHEEALRHALQEFMKTSEMGSPERKDEYRKLLQNECETLFKTTADCNKNLRLTKEHKKREETDKAYKEYKTEMDKAKKPLSEPEKDIRDRHDKAVKKVSDKYGNNIDKIELSKKTSEYLKEQVESNKEKKNQEDKARESKEKMELFKAKGEYIQEYEAKIEKEIIKLPTDVNFKAKCDAEKTRITTAFREKFATYPSYDEYFKDLETGLGKIFTKIEEQRKEKLKMKDTYINPEALKNSHEEAKEMIGNEWNKEFKSYPTDLTSSQKMRCFKGIDNEYKSLSRQNEKNKPQRPVHSNTASSSGGGCIIL